MAWWSPFGRPNAQAGADGNVPQPGPFGVPHGRPDVPMGGFGQNAPPHGQGMPQGMPQRVPGPATRAAADIPGVDTSVDRCSWEFDATD